MKPTAEAYTVAARRVLFEHPRVRVIEDQLEHAGRRFPYTYIESPIDSVAAVALTGEGNVVLTRQYRHALGAVVYDLPAGHLHRGEDPLEGARRELEEETGYRAGRMTPLGRFTPYPGTLKITSYLFLAEELTQVGQRLDEGEELEVVLMPFGEALERVRRGECLDASLQLGLLLAAPKGLAR